MLIGHVPHSKFLQWLSTQTRHSLKHSPTATEVHAHYVAWCGRHGYEPEGKQRFGSALKLCTTWKKGHGATTYDLELLSWETYTGLDGRTWDFEPSPDDIPPPPPERFNNQMSTSVLPMVWGFFARLLDPRVPIDLQSKHIAKYAAEIASLIRLELRMKGMGYRQYLESFNRVTWVYAWATGQRISKHMLLIGLIPASTARRTHPEHNPPTLLNVLDDPHVDVVQIDPDDSDEST